MLWPWENRFTFLQGNRIKCPLLHSRKKFGLRCISLFSTTDALLPHIFHMDGIHPHFEFYQCKTIFVIISLNKYQYLGERLEKGFTLATLNTKSRFCVNIYCGNKGLGSRSRIKKNRSRSRSKKNREPKPDNQLYIFYSSLGKI